MRITKEFYNKNAEKWATTHFTLDYWEDVFKRFQGFLSKGKILDIGCGPGRDAHFFVNSGYEYIGIDFSKELIKVARDKNPEVDFQIMDMNNLKFPEDSFDGFWAVASLLHIPKDKINIPLVEIYRILKPRGIGCVVIKEGSGEEIIKDRFFAFYSKDEFSKILENNGFEILACNRDLRDYDPPKNLTEWLIYFVRLC